MKTQLPLKLSPLQVDRILSADPEGVVIYDCRDYEQFERDHLIDSQWFPINQIEQILEKDIGDKLLVLICEYERSAEALLRRKEVNHVVILSGGYKQWVTEGYPTIRLPNSKRNHENGKE